MAEVLGVVASGIAVSQAAQTLGGLVMSLTRLWKEVRDVPETIRHILEDLEICGNLVGVIEAELKVAESTPSTPLTTLHSLAIHRCRQAHKDLGDLVDDLSADISSSRRRKRLIAEVKVVLKKDTLESHERRLQRALRFLDSAVQVHMAASLKRQSDLIAAKVIESLTLNDVIKPAVAAPSEPPSSDERREPSAPPAPRSRRLWRQRVVETQRKHCYSSALLGSFTIEFFEEAGQIRGIGAITSTSKYRFRLQPPPWLLKKAWEIQVGVTSSGWKTTFRQYVVMPPHSQVFNVMYDGTLEMLMELFDKRLASPFSIDWFSGLTLLHFAIYNARFDFVEPLVHMGLNFYVEDEGGLPAYSANGSFDTEQLATLHRSFLSHGVYDEVGAWEEEWVRGHMMGNPEVFDSFVANVFPDFYQWPLERRLQIIDCAARWTLHHRVIAKLFRPCGGLRQSDLRHSTGPSGLTLLQRVAEVYFRAREGSMREPKPLNLNYRKRRWMELRLIVREIAALAEYTDLCAPRPRTGKTCLLKAIRSSTERITSQWWNGGEAYNARRFRLQKQHVQESVRSWVEDIQSGGKDLVAYGRAERTAHRLRHSSDSEGEPGRELPHFSPRRGLSLTKPTWGIFTSGTFGPQLGNWALIWEWSPDVERFVGEFWACIEDPPLPIPGA